MRKKIKFLLIPVIFAVVALAGVGIRKVQDNCDVKVLIVGDSIGEGAGASEPSLKWYKYLVPYIKESYDKTLDITNVSMGGNTSYAGYARVMELEDSEDYELAIICYGENDKPEDFALYYESILWAVHQKYPSCRLMTILESSQRDYTEKIRTIQSISEHYKAQIVDTIAAFRDSGRSYEELCDDGIHPNDEGQKVYYEAVKETIDLFFTQQDMSEESVVNPVNPQVVDFENFKYVSVEDFQETDECAYELEMKFSQAGIGIDYTTVKGINLITMYIDGEKVCEKEIGWKNDFSMDYIEMMENECEISSKIRIEFSSREQMEAFHGIIINGYEVSE